MKNSARRVLGTPAVDYLPAAVLLVLATGFTAMTPLFSEPARPVPRLIGLITIVFCLLDLVSRSHTGAGRRIATWLNPAGLGEQAFADPKPGRLRRQALAFCAVGVFVLIFFLVGALPAVLLFGLFALRFGGNLQWRSSLIAAVALSAAVWLLFGLLLRLTLFPGVLFGGDW